MSSLKTNPERLRYQRELYIKNKERYKNYSFKYRELHREEISNDYVIDKIAKDYCSKYENTVRLNIKEIEKRFYNIIRMVKCNVRVVSVKIYGHYVLTTLTTMVVCIEKIWVS